MGSGQMAGGFDGWQGATPTGPDPTAIVTQIVAGPGITVSPPSGTGVVTVSLTGAPYTLNSLYTAGLSISDTANTLVGSYYNLFFADNGSMRHTQNVADSPVGSDIFSRRVLRWFNALPDQAEMDRFIVQNDVQNTEGSIFHTYWCQLTAGPSSRQFASERYQLQNNPLHDFWYDPQVATGFLSQLNLSLLFTDGSVHENVHQFLSDGPHLQNIIPPTAGGIPYAIAGTHYNLFSSSNPMNGTSVGVWSYKQGRINFYLDTYNSGTGRGISHVDFWLTKDVSGVNDRALQVFPIDSAILSTAGVAGLSFNTTLNRLQLSNNAGAYETILTGGPGDAAGVVDIASASQTFKAPTTTFTVVPTATGRRFMPTAAYIEFTSIAALTVGPTAKLGNNVAHDNVAPALAIANTAVTDTLAPFVMATDPVIISLTTTGIICEVTVNATGTTCTGRVHVLGVYV